jgi:hypothetical protein
MYPQYPDLTGIDLSWIEFSNSYYFEQITMSCAWADKALLSFHFDFGGPGPGCTNPYSKGWRDQPIGWASIYRDGIKDAGGNWITKPGSAFPHTVYAHIYRHEVHSDGTPEFVVQYWFFYPFNDWVADHEGDWEHIDVRFKGTTPETASLESVVYYFHHRCQRASIVSSDRR